MSHRYTTAYENEIIQAEQEDQLRVQAERAKQSRRIARAIARGAPLRQLMANLGVTEARIREVAATHHLEIISGKGSGRRW